MRTYTPVIKIVLSLALTLGLILPFHGQASAQSCDTLYPSPHQRIGYNVTRELDKTISDYDAARLGAGWYLDYATQVDPVRPNGMEYAQMVRARTPAPTEAQLETQIGAVIDANPGALWILGNEPDRQGQQDSIPPVEYATFYHDVHQFIKARDPSSQIAIAGVIQPTPLRLVYLSTVLSEYERLYGEEMPIDVWTTHAFILREQRPPAPDQPQDVEGNWGAGIPTGINGQDELGRLYDIDQHSDLEIFQNQLIALRQWMADNGQRDKELLVTEYGILFPDWFEGFKPDQTRDFMLDTFDFMLDAKDDQIGYAADGNRLVQRFSWFSLNSPGYDGVNANFFDHSLFDNRTFEIEFMGLAFEEYVAAHTVTFTEAVDLAIENVNFEQTTVITPTEGSSTLPDSGTTTITATVDLKNLGNIDAQNVTVRLWDVTGSGAPPLLDSSAVISSVAASCTGSTSVTLSWTVDASEKRIYSLMVDVVTDNQAFDSNQANNQFSKSYYVGTLDEWLYLPMLMR